MKLKQVEYCHNCNKDVEFEFDDTTDKQIIICPNCRHEHWRELDEGTLTSIRLHGRYQQYIYRPKIQPIHIFAVEDGQIPVQPMIEVERLEVIGQDEQGNAIVKGKGTKRISNRRWGRDRRQG